MRIQLLSDVHLEFSDFRPSELEVDVVVLAGDIDTANGRAVEWAADSFAAPVVFVPGNHDFYGGHLTETLGRLRGQASRTKGKVTVLDRDCIEIAGVRFLGATAWTDFSLHGDQAMSASDAEFTVSDYVFIRSTMMEKKEYRDLLPADLIEQNAKTLAWLRTELVKPFAGKTVVVTHHAPCPLSLPEWKRQCRDETNPAYANDWTGEAFWDPKHVQLWLHGHIHEAVDYIEKGVRVVTNPRGYVGKDRDQTVTSGFDTWFTVDV